MATYNSINSNVQGNNTFLGSGSGNITLTGDFNIGIGSDTLNSLTAGLENVGVGYNVLTTLTAGQQNVCVGNISGTAMTIGNFNTAVGTSSAKAITTGADNTALGTDALNALVTGDKNLALGSLAASSYTGAESSNICIAHVGVLGESNTIRIGTDGGGLGQQDTCYIAGDVTTARSITATTGNITATVGDIIASAGGITATLGALQAGTTVTAGTGVTATTGAITATAGDVVITAGNLTLPVTNGAGTAGEITVGAARFISSFGTDNTFVGETSGNTTLTGIENSGFGSATSTDLTTGSDNSLFGFASGGNITTGANNTGIGTGALGFLITGSSNTSLGYLSGSAYTGAESSNICIGNIGVIADANTIRLGTDGAGAGQQDTCYIAGDVTTARSLTSTTGNITATAGNVVITAGNLTLPNTNGAGTNGEITFGGNRWISNFGTANTFVGEGSGNTTLTTADNNVGVGLSSLESLTTADRSVAIGSQAGRFITTAANCVGVGYQALQGNSIGTPLTGVGNTAIGYQSGIEIGAGTYNILLGYGSAFQLTSGSYNVLMGINAPTIATGSSNIFIHGTTANAAESNIIRIGTTGAGNGQQNKCFIAGTTGVTPDTADAKLMIMDSLGQMGTLGAATNGQIAIGSTGANPVLATITAGSGIDVTNGAGTITVAAAAAQASFSAYLGAADSNVTGNGTDYQLGTNVAFTEISDPGADFNVNGTFTAPVTGNYMLSAQVACTGCTIATTFELTIVTTARTYVTKFMRPASADDYTIGTSVLADMAATNTAVVKIKVSGEAGDTVDLNNTNTGCRFSGYLVY